MPFVAGGVLAGVVCFVCAEWLSVDGVGIASGQKDFVLSVWDSLCRSWLLVMITRRYRRAWPSCRPLG